ncbi:glutathione S-transferase family protein [Sphingomonas sp. GlSt437]
MILYGTTLSPFVRKTLVAAREKGIEVTLERVGMGHRSPEFLEASPFGKMPALRDPGADNGKDFLLADSSAILHYLEAKQPEPALIPADPVDRGRAIWFDEFADTILFASAVKVFFQRVVAPKFLNRETDEALVAEAVSTELPPMLDYLERTVPDCGFLVASRLTIADISVASVFVNLGHGAYSVDAGSHPRLAAYVAGIVARPSFAPIVSAERKMLAAA